MPIDAAMPVEVQVLAYAALLAVAQLLLFAIPANIELGLGYTAGPRDEPREPSQITGRLQRAFLNHVEWLVLFTIAVVVVTLGEASSQTTETAAWVYLAARVLYVPAYVSGVPFIRSAIWAVGFFATVAMLIIAVT